MGKLYYGSESTPAVIPDRLLAHIKVVATTKLRRGESFTLSWRHTGDEPGGKTSLWMQPAIPLRFVFDSAEPDEIDPKYLKELAESAYSNAGLVIDERDMMQPDEQIVVPMRMPVAA